MTVVGSAQPINAKPWHSVGWTHPTEAASDCDRTPVILPNIVIRGHPNYPGMCPCVGPIGSEHGTSGPGLDPRPCRSHRATTAQLRASLGAVGDGRRGGPAIEKPGHLIVEAGTGVGKSFAYLVPAIQATADPKMKVVVSTHTIALQEQLLSKDIPFLRSVMPQEFSAVLVKGRSNYISLRRLQVAIQRQDSLFQRPEETDQLATIRMWSRRTQDGSRSDLDFRPLPTVWEAIQSEDGNCMGKQCPNYQECFFYRARRRMRSANVLVVNHALLVTDLALRGEGFGLLPDYDVAIIDEAHTLEAVAGEHLGMQLTNIGVDYTLARLYSEPHAQGPPGDPTRRRVGQGPRSGDPPGQGHEGRGR